MSGGNVTESCSLRIYKGLSLASVALHWTASPRLKNAPTRPKLFLHVCILVKTDTYMLWLSGKSGSFALVAPGDNLLLSRQGFGKIATKKLNYLLKLLSYCR